VKKAISQFFISLNFPFVNNLKEPRIAAKIPIIIQARNRIDGVKYLSIDKCQKLKPKNNPIATRTLALVRMDFFV
jgi:hypothetical protein